MKERKAPRLAFTMTSTAVVRVPIDKQAISPNAQHRASHDTKPVGRGLSLEALLRLGSWTLWSAQGSLTHVRQPKFGSRLQADQRLRSHRRYAHCRPSGTGRLHRLVLCPTVRLPERVRSFA